MCVQMYACIQFLVYVYLQRERIHIYTYIYTYIHTHMYVQTEHLYTQILKFPKMRGLDVDPQRVGLLLQVHPQKESRFTKPALYEPTRNQKRLHKNTEPETSVYIRYIVTCTQRAQYCLVKEYIPCIADPYII